MDECVADCERCSVVEERYQGMPLSMSGRMAQRTENGVNYSRCVCCGNSRHRPRRTHKGKTLRTHRQ